MMMKRNASGPRFPKAKQAVAAACALLVLTGCDGLWPKRGPKEAGRDQRQGLIEIGERALDVGQHLEEQALLQGAAEAYGRAVWAFDYYAQLTGTSPLLQDDARLRLERVQTRLQPRRSAPK